MIAAMGLRYGTPKSTAFSEAVHRAVALAAYNESVEMAAQRGAFEIYDTAREASNPYIQRLAEADPALYERMKTIGRRNIACLTIAPTGTTSLMTRTSSGIEPVFMPVYKRRRKINAAETAARVDYVDDSGDAFEEYIVYHPKFLEWMKIEGISTDRKYTQAELDEIVARSPLRRSDSKRHRLGRESDYAGPHTEVGRPLDIRHHKPAFRHICRSRRHPSTAAHGTKDAKAAPCTATARAQACLSLWEKRKRRGQARTKALLAKRPNELEADVVRFQNNKEKWIAFVGLVDGRPTKFSPARPTTKTVSSYPNP